MAEPTPIRGPRIRRAAVPTEADVVVRGDDLDPTLVRRQAEAFRRRFPDWGRYGLSAFYAADEPEIDDLGAAQLERFPVLLVLRVADLRAAGLEVVPTFRTPHVTIAFTAELDEGIAVLEALRVDRRANPYHGREPDGIEEEGDR